MKCSRPIVPGNDVIMKCSTCGFSTKASKLQKAVRIPVTCVGRFENQMYIDCDDLVLHHPQLKCDDIFKLEEEKVIQCLLSIVSTKFVKSNHKY